MISTPRGLRRRTVAALACVPVLAIAGAGACTALAGEVGTTASAIPRQQAMQAEVAYGPFRVPGDDGTDHLVMTLKISNTINSTVVPTSVTVTSQAGKRLTRVSGAALAAKLESVLIDPLPDGIPPSGVGVVTLDMGAATSVTAVTTRVVGTLAPGAELNPVVAQLGVNWTASTGAVPVSSTTPEVISPPVRGRTWANFNACCMASSHEFNRLDGGAGWRELEMFGIDFMGVVDGQIFSGDGSANGQYFGFGRPIVSATGGVVTSMRNDMEDIPPRTTPTDLKGIYEFAGNHVVVKMEPHVYVLYAHFKEGTVRVKVGQQVQPGQVLAKMGNSGFTSGPHLHFQLVDKGTLLGGESLPYVFNRYTRLGTLAEGDDSFVIKGKATAQVNTYPFALGAYTFAGAAG